MATLKTTLAAWMLALPVSVAAEAPAPSGDDDSGDAAAVSAVWLCAEDGCTQMRSEAQAEAAEQEAADEGRPVEVVVVTAPAVSPWQEWENRDSVYDDWDYRDPTDW